MGPIQIGVLGLGNVGAGVLRILAAHADAIASRLGTSVEVRRVLVRDLSRARAVEVASELLTTAPGDIVDDPAIHIVVELIGGTETARDLVLRALRSGKHVVTANKALMAAHGPELFEAAAAAGRALQFEGAVAGGIPVLRAIRHGLASDVVHAMSGIINGTCNFVLDQMTREGMGYEEAVREAQRAGFAEADPSLDVGGVDAAHKLAVLASLAFGGRVDTKAIHTEGIEHVRAYDIEVARRLGCVVRSVALASRSEAGIHLRVHPVLLAEDHVLAGVHGAFNAVLVDSAALGPSMYYGQGAGMMPTGAAVTSDIMDVAREILSAGDGAVVRRSSIDLSTAMATAPMDSLAYRNYLCVHAPHRAGVLGRVASALGRHGVSIAQMRQEHPGAASDARMVIITERVREADMVSALAEIDSSEDAVLPSVRIRFMESSG